MCRLCPHGGIPVPNCLNTRASSPSRSPPRAARPAGPAATTGSGGVASVPASVRSARAGGPGASTRSATPTGRPATPTGRPATPAAGPSETGAGAALAREASGASATSSSSRSSAVSAATNDSVKSLNTLTNIISRELHGITALANELKAWAESIEPAVYAERQMGEYDSWPAEVQRAYDDYKAAVKNCAAARAAFNAYMRPNRRTADPPVLLHCANLAITWGQAACKGAKKRIVFVEAAGRYAYKDVPSVITHIDQGLSVVNSGRLANREARTSIANIFLAMGRDVPGDDFFN